MSIHKRLPESIRAFGEQLQFLLQPRVWGSMSVLAIVGIFFWQFSENPEWFSLDEQTILDNGNPASELTPEEQAIAADIDSSKFLVEGLNSNNLGTVPLTPLIQVDTDLLKQANPSSKPNIPSAEENPFLEVLPVPSSSLNPSQPQNPTQGNTSLPVSEFLKPTNTLIPSASSSNLNSNVLGSPSEPTGTPPPASPLQQAMQQYLQNKSAVSTNPTANTTNPSVNATTSSSLSPNNITNPSQALNGTSGLVINSTPFNSSPPITGQLPQSTWTVPRSNPNTIPGTVPTPIQNPYQTNRTLPPAVPTVPTVTPGGQYSNLNLYPNTNQPYPNLNNAPSYPGYSNYSNTYPGSTTVQPVQPNTYMTPSNMNPNLQPSQLAQPQTPFSVPNRIPGSYIGGGEINTFSNP